MKYSPYTIANASRNQDPYKINNTTTTGYIVETHNANNING